MNIGSIADPLEFPGLAHFCEHMLFYASAKYPKEDDYSKFIRCGMEEGAPRQNTTSDPEWCRCISDHGGYTNAWTASENTNYQFCVNAEHLEVKGHPCSGEDVLINSNARPRWQAAIDRFAQFFIAPLISGDGVEREVNAVDSEHR